MRRYMPKVGGYGLDMMFRTCTVQVNLDFESEADMVKKFRVGLALQPVTTALFANSPFREGRPSGFLSYRAQIWTDVDNARAGMLPWVFEDGMGFERYVDYALDVPMYFVYRDGKYIDVAGKSFRDFLARKIPEVAHIEPIDERLGRSSHHHLPGSAAEDSFWKCAAPMAASGGASAACRRCGSAFYYDSVALDAAWDLVKDWTAEERQAMRDRRRQAGFKTPFRKATRARSGAPHAGDFRGGLEAPRRRLDAAGMSEEGFLNAAARTGQSRGYTRAEEC